MDNTNNKDKNRVFLLKTTLFGKLITSFIIAIIYKLPQPLFVHCDREGKKRQNDNPKSKDKKTNTQPQGQTEVSDRKKNANKSN